MKPTIITEEERRLISRRTRRRFWDRRASQQHFNIWNFAAPAAPYCILAVKLL